jgi:hypothetical protein
MSVYDDELADDFAIPDGVGWNISTVEVGGEYNGTGPANSVKVNFYANGGSNRRGRCSSRDPISRSRTVPTSPCRSTRRSPSATGRTGSRSRRTSSTSRRANGDGRAAPNSRTPTPPGRTRTTDSGPAARRGPRGRRALDSWTDRIMCIGSSAPSGRRRRHRHRLPHLLPPPPPPPPPAEPPPAAPPPALPPPPSVKCRVPGVVGQSLATASRMIRRAGCSVVPRRTPVTLRVSRGR